MSEKSVDQFFFEKMALLSFETLEKLPILGYYVCLLRQIWDYLYSYTFMLKWMVTREWLSPHIDLILNGIFLYITLNKSIL